MSQSRLLQCHKLLKAKLRALRLRTYADAQRMLGHTTPEAATILGRTYKLTYYADVYPPNDDIVVAVFLTRPRFPCDEGYSSAYRITQNNEIKYMSQKQQWAFGF